MFIAEYESCFHALSSYSIVRISIELENIHKFVKGLEGPYQLATDHMVVSGPLFYITIEHAKLIESIT